MFRARRQGQLARLIVPLLAAAVTGLACARENAPVDLNAITPVGETTPVWLQGLPPGEPTVTLPPPSPPVPGVPTVTPRPTQDIGNTPTPDPTRPTVLDRQSVEEYTVARGDSLSGIGERYGVSPAEIAAANGMQVADTLFVGQVLRIPVPNPHAVGSAFKLLPDSELVYGPGAIDFNLNAFVQAYGGYLAQYEEEIEARFLDGNSARTLTGAEIVQLVAERYSVNPRLLLAALEYQSGWVRDPQPSDNTLAFPIGFVQIGREGLYRQLSWAANQLNFGYYAWRAAAIVSWSFGDGSIKLIAPGQNAGSVGVQNFFASLLIPSEWDVAVARDGFFQTYVELFGNPFRLAHEPLVPASIVQPPLQLPFEPGRVWAYTGGPHGAWDTGSAWAALDFAPPSEVLGCYSTEEWVTATASGLVVRTGDGVVIQDLDGDGYEQTGWVLFYLHVEARDRVQAGTQLEAGERIGHPSCEGGVSEGTHVHLARKYNGEWIAADGPVPFVLDGWVSAGLGREYDGTLSNGERTLEACSCRAPGNEVARP
jgi:murein DD-endopeptidase MepM/ murein hydrolase activator NlpD